jgi:hypothetical protein
MADCVIFVEGTSNTTNSNLCVSLGKLLGKAKRPQPDIKMANDMAGAIKKFLYEIDYNNSAYKKVLLLIDLDGPESTRAAWLARHKLTPYQNHVFFMVQEMEAWFLAQPDVLNVYYPKLQHDLAGRSPMTIAKPSSELAKRTKHSSKGTYAKVRDGALLLPMLDLAQLQADFPDVYRLVAEL